MSLPAWITFFVCAAAVFIHYTQVRNTRFLLFAIPALLALLLIPMILAWMSRRTLREAAEQNTPLAKFYKIAKVTLAMTGQAVSISGKVKKISFQWLNRPHFHIEDSTGQIRVIMFTSPAEDIRQGDEVDVLGVVIKNIFKRSDPAISAVSVKKRLKP